MAREPPAPESLRGLAKTHVREEYPWQVPSTQPTLDTLNTQLLVPLYLQMSLLAHLTNSEKIRARILMYIQLDNTHERASALQERRDSLCNVAKNVDV